MSKAPVLMLLAAAAIWSFGAFGRDRQKHVEPTGTIKDLERAPVQVDTQATIVGSEAKAMESYRMFLDGLFSGDREAPMRGRRGSAIGSAYARRNACSTRLARRRVHS